jgi:fatty acid desaturase
MTPLAGQIDRQETTFRDSGGLARVGSDELRRNLPRALFAKRPAVFLVKFSFGLAIIGAGYAVILLSTPWYAKVVAGLVVGAMYAHILVLQHDTLHEHVFNSRFLNRAFGTVCGLFMLSSYTHYKHAHLRHHSLLGKPGHKEFFNDYNGYPLTTVRGIMRAAWHLGRYVEVAGNIGRSLRGRRIIEAGRERENRLTAQEYRLFLAVCIGCVAYTALTGSLFLIYAWVLPTLLVAEPVYFLIELPEHFGLNIQSNPNVFENTRTIKASWLGRWFTHLNNFHTAHHYHQGVPLTNVGKLDRVVSGRYVAAEPTYWGFYRKVLKGEIK